MIPCPECGFENPMGTRWCRQCGTKLDLTAAQIETSILATKTAQEDERLLGMGRSILTMGAFALVAVIVLRVALVPRLPLVEPPVQLPQQLIPVVEHAVGSALGIPEGNTPVTSQRLRWRATVCRTIAQQLGLDLAAMDAAAERVATGQKADGSWTAEDPLAATGLATLTLQSWPTDTGLARAQRARRWLSTQLADPSRRSPVGRALAMTALDDAEELSATERTRLQAYLIDGKAARWQTWMLTGIPKADHPPELALVRGALKSDLWTWQLQFAAGTRPELDAKHFFTEAAPRITAVDRLPWAFLAWHLVPAPDDLKPVLHGWSRSAPLEVDEELAKAGPHAADAVWLLALSAPTRLPPLWSAGLTP